MSLPIGFLINSRVPSAGALLRRMPPSAFFTGWDDPASPMSLMRFRWLARELRMSGRADYSLYVPGRRYAAVVFVKSMTPECYALARRLQESGTRIVFDANVDYYTEADFSNIPPELVPTGAQRVQAIAMTKDADFVIASSSNLAGICRKYHPTARWIPDNVNPAIVRRAAPVTGPVSPLPLWWSGMPQKFLDFLSIEEVLRKFRRRIHLHLVTGDYRAAITKMPEESSRRVEALLAEVPHTFYRFRSVEQLLGLYGGCGGLIISPRFLDNPYNLSHSEWKISLGMACGLPAIANPQPSYLDVAGRCAHTDALRICLTPVEWAAALEQSLGAAFDWGGASCAAAEVVERHYSTRVVAAAHLDALHAALSGDQVSR